MHIVEDLIRENLRTRAASLELREYTINGDEPFLSLLAECEHLEELHISFICGYAPLPKSLKKLVIGERGSCRFLYEKKNLPPFDGGFLHTLPPVEILEINHWRITDFSFIKAMPSLRELRIRVENAPDLGFLEGLACLEVLHLTCHGGYDLQPLASLKSLRRLYIERKIPYELKHNLSNADGRFGFLEGLPALKELELEGYDSFVTNVEFLRCVPNLEIFRLNSLRNNDCTPFAYVPNLTTLCISLAGYDVPADAFRANTKLEDFEIGNLPTQGAGIAFLACLPNLKKLRIGGGILADWQPLAGLKRLEKLDLSYSNFSDYALLAQLPELMDLRLYESPDAKNLAGLAGLTNLRRLSLCSCKVSKITPLAALTKLECLILNWNGVTDISVLANMPALEQLEIAQNKITNIAVLANNKRLKILDLARNKILDIGVLAEAKELKFLNVSKNRLTDAAPIACLPNLEFLELSQNPLEHLPAFVESLMRHLNVAETKISSVEALHPLKNLRYLSMRVNDVHDISPLSALSKLEHLELNANPFEDLSPLAGLNRLAKVEGYKCAATDISPLLSLPNLRELDFANCKISSLSLEQARTLARLDNANIRENPIKNLTISFRKGTAADMLAYLEQQAR